jgi:hypothetical protein
MRLVAPLIAVAFVGGLALIGSSLRSTTATSAPVAPANGGAAAASWQAFQAHVGLSLPSLETDITTLANGGAAGYITATSSGIDITYRDALGEVAWLQANPAASCYTPVYADYLSINQTLATAMTDAGHGDYATANMLIGQLNVLLARLALDTPKTVC